MRDYYYILGISENANNSEIKTAYRKLSLKFHPDKNNGEKYFEERFKEIQDAYEILSDSIKRKNYNIELNRYRSSRTNKNKEEDELKRKYSEELRRKEEEIRNEYQAKEKKLKEEFEKIKAKSKNNNINLSFRLIFIILFVSSLILFQIYKHFNKSEIIQNKEHEDLINFSDYQIRQNNDDKNIESKSDVVAKANEKNETFEINSFELTKEQLEKYYRDGKNDDNIILFRKKLNEFIAGDNEVDDEIEKEALDNMNYYGIEYLDSKFFLASIEDGIYGGKWMQIVFINKPDKVFSVWILHGRVVDFRDAEWNKEAIKMVQNDKQALNPKYGF